MNTAHIETSGATLQDSSGLSVDDRLTAKTLDAVVQAAAGPDEPALRPLLDLLPIAGGSGTLSDRFLDRTANTGPAGWLRAKTGSLTAVNALAGVVTDHSGRVLTFALISNDAGPTGRTAIDAWPPLYGVTRRHAKARTRRIQTRGRGGCARGRDRTSRANAGGGFCNCAAFPLAPAPRPRRPA